jgi:hypothetical protein
MVVVARQGGPVQLPAIKGTARWVGGAPSAWSLECGSAYLVITTAKGSRGDYWVGVIRDGAKLVGYRLTRFDLESGEDVASYEIDVSFGPGPEGWSCDCPSATFRPRVCKHAKAVHASLKQAGLL